MPRRKKRPFLVSWGWYDSDNEDEVYVLENMEEVTAFNAGDAIERASIPRGTDWVESLLIDEHVRKMIDDLKEEAGEDS